MAISKKSLQTLVDLVEIKLSCLEIMDREDLRERQGLEQCLYELASVAGKDGFTPVNEPKRRGRRPKIARLA